MTKTRSTKTALLSSVLALFLCITMLLGTTFAWFTDSVTSANNIITAGNLDVELYYMNDEVTTWTKVDGNTNVFKENTLWEPGHVEVVKLEVRNEGTLALKYQLGVNVASEVGSVNVNDESFKLSSFIKFAVIEGDKTFTRDEAVEAAEASNATFLNEAFASDSIELAAGANKVVTMVVYMPTSIGNDANAKKGATTPTINLGINVYATQVMAEADSFGTDYDKDAVYPGTSAPSTLGDEAITLVTEGENASTVVLPADLIAAIDNGTITSVALKTSLPNVEDDNGAVSVVYNTFEVVDQDGNAIDLSNNTSVISVKLYVGKDYAGKNATISHDGVMIANADVDAEGFVSYNTTHFCEIAVKITETAPEAGMDDVKDEEAEDLTKLVQVLVGNHYYTVSQGMANSWKVTTANGEQIYADIYVPEDLIAYAMMHNNGDITMDSGVHSYLTLKNNLDFKGYNWIPIGRFYTEIKGENKTISNLNNSFLGCVYDCRIENLTLENVTASGSAAGVVGKELAGDIYLTNVTIAGTNTVTYVKDNATNWPEEGTGVGAICGISLIGCSAPANVNVTVTGTIEVNYNGVFFGNNTNLENLGVSKEFGLNVYKVNAGVNVTGAENITTNGQGYLFDVADLEDGFAQDKISNKYYVFNAAGLAAFASEVNAGNTFKGKTVVLYDNVDLENKDWTPIGNSTYSFQGTFDGNGKVISNLKVDMAGKSNAGLFGMTTNGEVKNLTVENAIVTGRLNVGVVAGTPYTSKYTNITVKGHVEVNGMSYVGCVGGKNAYANWDKITVDVDDTSYVNADSVENGTAYRTYVGGVIGFMGEGTHKVTNVASNINVSGSTCDVGGIVGIAHEGNTFENIVCTGNVEITNASEAADAEEMGGIAGVWMNSGRNVTFNNCIFTGKLASNIEDVDLSNNTITGKGYNDTTSNKLIIDGKEFFVFEVPTDLEEEGQDPISALNGLLANEESKGKYISIEGDVAGAAAASNAYGATGLNIKDGQTIDGNGMTLKVEGANGTWDSAVNITSGAIKNITINSGFRGVFVNHNGTGGKVYLENVIIDGTVYTISCDQGTGYGLEAVNSTFNGWTSYAATIGEVKFVNCSFGEGSGYSFCRPYAPTEFVGCDFEAGFEMDPRAKVTFENCTIGGEALTAENLATLVISNIANASVK